MDSRHGVRTKIYSALLFCLALAPGGELCAASALKPGEYIRDHAPPHALTLKREADGTLAFSIASMSPGKYSCSIEGEIKGVRAVVPSDDTPDVPCIVSFVLERDGIKVTSDHTDSCRAFCAYVSTFDGLYLKPRKGCAPSEVTATRNKFKTLYARKAYTKALRTLEPLLGNCEPSLAYEESNRVRNDLAITYYHLRNLRACREVLAPLESAAETYRGVDESDLRSGQESFLPLMKATLFNLDLCGAASQTAPCNTTEGALEKRCQGKTSK